MTEKPDELSKALGIDILYEEGPVIALNKPSGLLTQAPIGIDSLEFRIKDYLIQREQKAGKCYLGVPHRLDRPASGLIVFAKHSRAANRLSEQFETRVVHKKYWALVSGLVPDETGTWIDYMRKVPNQAHAELRAPIHPDAREAVLHYVVKKRMEDITWLEIQLETGRTHQIRLQSSSRGFPLLGDVEYGSAVPFGNQHEDTRLNAIALHSREMIFTHPMTHEKICLTAPVPPAWKVMIGDSESL